MKERLADQEAAFKDLFTREYDRLCQYALSYMQDAHLAEDVVQDTFIRIWETKRELIQTDHIRFYLITAVKNNCISALRKQKTQGVQLTENTPEPEPEPHFMPHQHAEAEGEQARKIADALNQLPPKCKEIFLMIKLHGMSYKQAAETLDLSVKTVENQMGKAIRILREFALAPSSAVYLILLLRKCLTGLLTLS